jgi:sugar O-acyltransferase (sialic acid O-acetyltransferase NeuD family)
LSFNLIIVGAGGLGREVYQYARDIYGEGGLFRVKGFLDDNPHELIQRGYVMEVNIVGNTKNYAIQDNDRFIVAIGDPGIRQMIVERLIARGAQFTTLVHPKAYVAPSAQLGVGCIISPFATIATFTRLEDHVVLGFYAHVGHDSQVGKYGVLSPYAAVNGGVVLGTAVFLGTHATVTPGRKVGSDVQIAAGAVVYQDIPANRLVVGNPAKVGPKF